VGRLFPFTAIHAAGEEKKGTDLLFISPNGKYF